MTSVSEFRPVTSEKPARSRPPVSSKKLKPPKGSLSRRGICAFSFNSHLRLFRNVGAALELRDAEDDELRGLGRGDTDFRYDAAQQNGLRRVRFLVAFHEEGLLFGRSDKSPRQPLQSQECRDVAHQRLP